MSRLTVAGLHRMAKAASATEQPTLTIVTHPDGGERYAAWGYGCIHLPAALVEDLMWPEPGSYRITARGQLEPAEVRGLSAALVIAKMLPHLDTPRAPTAPNGWLYERGELRMRLLDADQGPATAVRDDLWQPWTKALPTCPTWQADGGVIAWADTASSRAHALLMPIHHRFVPTPPEDTAP